MNLGISQMKKKKTKMVGLQRGLPAAKKRNTGAHAGGVGRLEVCMKMKMKQLVKMKVKVNSKRLRRRKTL